MCTVEPSPCRCVADQHREDNVRFSFNIPNFGLFADPRLFADLARTVEEAGWDGLLTWNALIGERWRRMETADPWILLTAAGLATTRIRLGTAVTPLARRRVRKARQRDHHAGPHDGRTDGAWRRGR